LGRKQFWGFGQTVLGKGGWEFENIPTGFTSRKTKGFNTFRTGETFSPKFRCILPHFRPLTHSLRGGTSIQEVLAPKMSEYFSHEELSNRGEFFIVPTPRLVSRRRSHILHAQQSSPASRQDEGGTPRGLMQDPPPHEKNPLGGYIWRPHRRVVACPPPKRVRH